MSPKQIGLTVFAGAGGLFVLAAAGVALLAFAGTTTSPIGTKEFVGSERPDKNRTGNGGRADPPVAPAPTAKDKADPDYQAILSHKFFDRKLSAPELDRLIDLFLTGNRSHTIYVGASGKFLRAEYGPEWGDTRPPVEGIERPYFLIDMRRWASRPTRREVVEAIKARLDQAEFERRD